MGPTAPRPPHWLKASSDVDRSTARSRSRSPTSPSTSRRVELNSHTDARHRSRFREGLALLLIATSALCLQLAATSPWVRALAATGTIYKVSPIGLASWPSPSASTPTAECRWWPKIGNAELCAIAPSGDAALVRLRRAYPLAVVAMWSGILALFLNALRLPRQSRGVRIVSAAISPLLAVGALWSVANSAGPALVVLDGLTLDPILPGYALIVTAIACGAAATMLLLSSKGQVVP